MAGFFIVPTEGPELGFQPESVAVTKCRNRVGGTLSKGDVAVLDFRASATEVLTSATASYIPGTGETVWKTLVDPSAANIPHSWHVVVEDKTILDNGLGRARVYGLTQAFVVGSRIKPGTPLRPTTTNSFAVATTNQRWSALYLAPSSSPTARLLKNVFVFGCIIGGMVPRS